MKTESRKSVQKPVGIYVVSIAVIIVLGIFQLFRYWIEYQSIKDDLPFTMVFIPLFLCIFTILSAIWATVGDNLSRIALLLHIYKSEYRNFWEKDIGKIKENDILGFRESKKIKYYLGAWVFNPPWWIGENKRAKFLLLIYRFSALLLFLIHSISLVLIALFLS